MNFPKQSPSVVRAPVADLREHLETASGIAPSLSYCCLDGESCTPIPSCPAGTSYSCECFEDTAICWCE